MIDSLLDEISERGYRLSYLNQRSSDRGPYTWEAMLLSPILEPRGDGYLYTSGYGCGHTALQALDSAMDAILRDPHNVEPFQPASFTLEPAKPLSSLFSNLRKTMDNPFKGRRL